MISPALIQNAELIINGSVAAGGSNSRAFAAVFNYRRFGSSGTPNKTALANAFIAQVKAPLLAALNVRFAMQNVAVRWLNDALDAPFIVASRGAGGVAGDSMPTDNAVFVLFQTGLRGKSYRGGKHFFPIAESATTTPNDDILNAGAIALFGTLATAMLAAITDSGGIIWVPSLVSRKLSQLRTNPTTVTANDINAISVNKRIGSMRHRKVRSVY